MAAFGFMSIFIYQLQSFGGLWFVVLGLFLQNLAKTSYKQEIMRSSLETIFVRDVMRRDVQTINPDITLNDLVKNWFMIYGYKIFPVLENGKIIGTISTEDVKLIPKDRWLTTTVMEALKPIKESQLINLESKVMDALHKMNGNQLDYLLIIEQNRLLGIIYIDDIMRYVKLKRDFKI
ncbi:unnamed protein product [marine sediment metagenome]|uniref:CBS domain-containing protein n=1 Tax=marine sediment metagenome TaxID=412755 RepID=X0Z5V1_9ZZZZ